MATFFRTQNHVPDVYSRKSRDFQLFCNIFDCLNDGIKYDIDSMLDIVDTNQCNERLLSYLQTKLGFWSKEKISADRVRIILKGFVSAVRNKGSITGVERAVQLFLKVIKVDTPVHIEVINEVDKSRGNVSSEPYTILIGTEEKLRDTKILDEILKYIIPAGYSYKYVFYSSATKETNMEYADSVKVITGSQALLGAVRTTFTDDTGAEILYPSQQTITGEGSEGGRVLRNIIGNVDLTVVASNRVPYPTDDQYAVADKVRNPVSSTSVVDEKQVVTTDKSAVKNLYSESIFEDK